MLIKYCDFGINRYRYFRESAISVIIPITFFVAVAFLSSPFAAAGNWSIELNSGCGGGEASEPVVANGTVFIGSGDGAVYAVNADAGELKWRFQTGQNLSATPETTVVPGGTSVTEMINAYEKSVKGHSKGRRYISATPVVYSNTVYIGSWDNTFYALDAASGKVKWCFDAGVPVYKRALVSGNKIIFVTGGHKAAGDKVDGRVYCLNLKTGKLLWKYETLPKDVKAKWPSHLPVIRDNIAYAVNWDAKHFSKGDADSTYLHSIDIDSGKAQWSVVVKGGWPSPPVINGNYIFIVTDDRGKPDTSVLHAIDISNGQEVWRFEVVGGKDYWRAMDTYYNYTAPITNENSVFLATDKAIIAIDINTGKEQWHVGETLKSKEWISDINFDPLLYFSTKKDGAVPDN